ncbi:MAG TPA: hypothetical protein VFY66_18585 [Anaerolineales bacterium]|nr:hypothetical protein [Anaerolineales bacterium]
MNHFFYESSSKEKIEGLRKEGMNSQAYHRSGAPKLGRIGGLPKLALALLGALGLLGLLIR